MSTALDLEPIVCPLCGAPRATDRRHDPLMQRAQELIRCGVPTNREIADRLGFCDEYHFSRRFKQVVGLSPKEFRALARSPAGHTL